MMKLNNIKGFTLIELSVVLVIIAILAGAVLTGQGLIKTAELNAFVSDVERFKSAFSRFQAQYEQLPGDMDNAFDYWGCDCAYETSCGPDAADATLCNGDGNAKSQAWLDPAAWKHLSLSGYIDDYIETITEYPADRDCIIGTSLPVTALSNLHALITQTPNDYAVQTSSATVPVPGQLLVFGSSVSTNTYSNCGNLGYFTAEQLYTIDKKMDDGFAYSGRVVNSQNVVGCTTSANTGSGDLDDGVYDLANNGTNLCKLYVRLKVD